MDLTMKYTGQGTLTDATKPGAGSVTYSAGNAVIQAPKHLMMLEMWEVEDGWPMLQLTPILHGFATTSGWPLKFLNI